MHSTSSYIFSSDARATAFRRAVRSRVAHNHEYAVPGSGANAQEVQREYLRYCAEQHQGHSDATQESPPPYMPFINNQAPPTYRSSMDDQASPPYTSDPTSDMTPTARLDMLLYSSTSALPSPPEYAEAIFSLPPASYGNVALARTPTTSSSSMNQRHSHQTINALFTNCTTRTRTRQIHSKAIQALELVVVSDGIKVVEVSPRYSPTKKTGILRWIKDRV